MSDQTFPVTVAVNRPDGSTEHVRVGTATRMEDGFSLQLGELSIGSTADVRSAAAPARRANPGEAIFPPYGRSKGAPIAGATMQDLEFYANGSRRTLSDPSKSRWHEKERVMLATIEAEIARQGGTVPQEAAFSSDGPPPHSDDDMPF